MKAGPVAVVCILSSVWLFKAVPARAIPPQAIQALLMQGSTPEDLRAKLGEWAEQHPEERNAAAECLYLRGVSFERASSRDSAIACYRRALELRGGGDERLALADALFLRRQPGDVEEGLRLSRAGLSDPGARFLRNEYLGRLAWGLTLAGRADTARVVYQPLIEQLRHQPQGLYRLGRTYFDAGDPGTALPLLVELAVASREQDEQTLTLLREAARSMGAAGQLDGEITRQLALRDRQEQETLDRMGGQRVAFEGRDGFALGGVALLPAATRRPRAAVVLVAPGSELADYDSLAATLVRGGFAVLLMDVRGSGWSVAPACPSPDTWTGRQEALQRLVASDVPRGLERLAALAPIDTASYLAVGTGETATMAVQAAALDRRIRALLLLSPKPAVVDRGPTRARLERLHLPVYFLSAPDDGFDTPVTDQLYRACNQSASLVTETRQPGRGAVILRNGPVAARLIRWLNETIPGTARRAIPPRSRRRG